MYDYIVIFTREGQASSLDPLPVINLFGHKNE